MNRQELFNNAPRPFEPNFLPLDSNIFIQKDIFTLVSKANSEIGKYNGFLSTLINPMLLISPLITQEAVISSKLEGTHATLEDLLHYEAGNKVDIESDEIQEIINYRKSLFYALEKISTINSNEDNKLPLTSRIIKEMHKILLDNVRGNSKNPGNFKRQQNYIGSNNQISFTPVSVDKTDKYMGDLENYLHSDDIDILIQAAIIHAQFEMIHPFEDGNGRIGRLLIPLFLYYKELLPYPTFYMSSYFEKDRALYISHLQNISKNNDWISWVKYFLEGVIYASKESTNKARNISSLYEHMKTEITPKLKSVHSIELLDFIFRSPIFSAKQVEENTPINLRTVYTLLSKLEETDYIKSSSAKRYKTYYCPHLLNIVE